MTLARILQRLIIFLVVVPGVIGQFMIVHFLYMLGVVVLSFDGTPHAVPAECALVFGAAVHRGDVAGPAIYRRVRTAVELYREGEVERLILTGGLGESLYQQKSEADVMRDVALTMGVDSGDVVLEEQAQSTWENIQFSEPLLADCDSIVGISDRYHLARIALIAEKRGWENVGTFPASQHPTFLFELRSVLREAVGLMYYSFLQRGVIDGGMVF